jgi:hypothetical protein
MSLLRFVGELIPGLTFAQDSLQAFSSSIASLLSSRAVLEGVFQFIYILFFASVSRSLDLNDSVQIKQQG